ncbi:hypothetical protein [Thermotoga sp. Ku-13t]|uniref:glycoside hydrolase family 130 protein n=1 Tax=Thermotoga sp. Ku-13t TaxID=1755813 RepID=UPI0019D21893
MVFRNDCGSFQEQRIEGTNLGLAFSEDGIEWEVSPELLPMFADEPDAIRIYDPRLVILEGKLLMIFALSTFHSIRAGIASTEDFKNFELMHLSTPDSRNIVLFPRKVNGYHVRLEKPFPVYGKLGMERFDIWISFSPDLRFWRERSNCFWLWKMYLLRTARWDPGRHLSKRMKAGW